MKSILQNTTTIDVTGKRIIPSLYTSKDGDYLPGDILDANTVNQQIDKVVLKIDNINTLLEGQEKGEDQAIYQLKDDDEYYPVSHPDISTQPSLLSERFGKWPIYEVAIPLSGIMEVRSSISSIAESDIRNITGNSPADMIFLDAKLINTNQPSSMSQAVVWVDSGNFLCVSSLASQSTLQTQQYAIKGGYLLLKYAIPYHYTSVLDFFVRAYKSAGFGTLVYDEEYQEETPILSGLPDNGEYILPDRAMAAILPPSSATVVFSPDYLIIDKTAGENLEADQTYFLILPDKNGRVHHLYQVATTKNNYNSYIKEMSIDELDINEVQTLPYIKTFTQYLTEDIQYDDSVTESNAPTISTNSGRYVIQNLPDTAVIGQSVSMTVNSYESDNTIAIVNDVTYEWYSESALKVSDKPYYIVIPENGRAHNIYQCTVSGYNMWEVEILKIDIQDFLNENTTLPVELSTSSCARYILKDIIQTKSVSGSIYGYLRGLEYHGTITGVEVYEKQEGNTILVSQESSPSPTIYVYNYSNGTISYSTSVDMNNFNDGYQNDGTYIIGVYRYTPRYGTESQYITHISRWDGNTWNPLTTQELGGL